MDNLSFFILADMVKELSRKADADEPGPLREMADTLAAVIKGNCNG